MDSVQVGNSPEKINQPYHRYALTADGISPRLLPGLSEHLVVCDSDEHTSDGHITEDLQVRRQMVDKRLRKLEGLRSEVTPPQYWGDDNPEILLVTWGSNWGAVMAGRGNAPGSGAAGGSPAFFPGLASGGGTISGDIYREPEKSLWWKAMPGPDGPIDPPGDRFPVSER